MDKADPKAPEFTPEFGRDGDSPADGRLDGWAFHKNHAPIRDALVALLAGRDGAALEIGGGTGQHVVGFAEALPKLTWWASDTIPRHVASIAGWRAHAGHANLQPPFVLDAGAADWQLGRPDRPPVSLAAIVAINVLHITAWAITRSILRAAGAHLDPAGRLLVYGPFKIDGTWTADSNAVFSRALSDENPAWGVRDTADLATEAATHGLVLAQTLDMPSNNFVLVFERGA